MKKFDVFFDVTFRMVTTVQCNTPEEAIELVGSIPEAELMKFEHRDAPEVNVRGSFESK